MIRIGVGIVIAIAVAGCGGGPTVVDDLPWLVASSQSDGKVAVIAALDFECDYSRQQFTLLEELDREQYEVVFRYYSRTEQSISATRGALCSREQGRETVFGPALFRQRAALGRPLTDPDVFELASETDMDERSFEHCMTTPVSDELIRNELTELRNIGVEVLPTLFVGRERHDGYVGAGDFEASAERERSRRY